MNYQSLRDQRTNNRMPKLELACSIAYALHTSVEFLVTGKERDSFPPRIQTIAICCLSASEEDLALIERVLRIEAEKIAISMGHTKLRDSYDHQKAKDLIRRLESSRDAFFVGRESRGRTGSIIPLEDVL